MPWTKDAANAEQRELLHVVEGLKVEKRFVTDKVLVRFIQH
jgi:hypothetical protein